jgi:hypothetical protein
LKGTGVTSTCKSILSRRGPDTLFSRENARFYVRADGNGALGGFVRGINYPTGGAFEGALSGNGAVTTNTWYHLVQIFQSNGTCSAFLNSASIGSVTNTSGTTGSTWTNLTIGRETNSNSYAFNGYIDDLRIYNVAVSNIEDLTTEIFTQGNGVAGNPRLGGVVCDSQVALIDSLDIVSDSYYNTGYTEMSTTVQSQTLVVDASTVVVVVKSAPGAPTAVSGALYPSGAASGIRVGSQMVLADRLKLPLRALEPKALERIAMAEVVAVSDYYAELKLTAGTKFPANAQWVAIPHTP